MPKRKFSEGEYVRVLRPAADAGQMAAVCGYRGGRYDVGFPDGVGHTRLGWFRAAQLSAKLTPDMRRLRARLET